MATSHEIKCINKSERYNIHERILSIGGISNDGSKWKLSLTDAIEGIENNKWTFYVNNVIVSGTSTSQSTTTALDFFSSLSSGDEGGEIRLNKPATNSTISGVTTIDMFQNKIVPILFYVLLPYHTICEFL